MRISDWSSDVCSSDLCSDIGPARTRNAAATRHAILLAATGRFLQDSYECVGLRDIARDAGIDVALVSRYFGSKEELFAQVLRGEGEEKIGRASCRERVCQSV